MSKEQFLRMLHSLLKDLPEDELERIIGYYREMIEDKVESGQTEQQAVAGLGTSAHWHRRFWRRTRTADRKIPAKLRQSVLPPFSVRFLSSVSFLPLVGIFMWLPLYRQTHSQTQQQLILQHGQLLLPMASLSRISVRTANIKPTK